MNIVNRFLYWNMNYHIEHHIFPTVPYYNLPALRRYLEEHGMLEGIEYRMSYVGFAARYWLALPIRCEKSEVDCESIRR